MEKIKQTKRSSSWRRDSASCLEPKMCEIKKTMQYYHQTLLSFHRHAIYATPLIVMQYI